MNSTIPRCLRTPRPARILAESTLMTRSSSCHRTRPFSTSSPCAAEEDRPSKPTSYAEYNIPKSTPPPAFGAHVAQRASAGGISAMGSLGNVFNNNERTRNIKATTRNPLLDVSNISSIGEGELKTMEELGKEEPHHFHVYATRHNCHITLTKPDREPLLSISCGNLGFKKSKRKEYDSAFQLGSFALNRIREKGWLKTIDQLSVTLRGYGAGREAVTKALLGTEGKLLRGKIIMVQDATRLKFGGTRSKAPRRLG